MQEMAEKYADQAHFPFVYIREAHPGEVYPPHESLEQKISRASPPAVGTTLRRWVWSPEKLSVVKANKLPSGE